MASRRALARSERRVATDHAVIERSPCRKRSGVDQVSDGSALHVDDGLMPVAAVWGCRQTDDVTTLDLGEDPFEGDRR